MENEIKFDRKIIQEFVKWKNSANGKSALLVDGARRIGKSRAVEMFGEKYYKSYILIDFNKNDKMVESFFENYLNDLDTFFMYLETYFKTKLYPRDSLIIFDEVQQFPKARSSIKYLVQDGRFDYIETGSLMSIKKNVQDIVIPSEERHIKMYPMDFEEFLWATGNREIFDLIKTNWEKKQPLGQVMHRKIINIFREYMLVGGMPQVVKCYVKTKDFEAVDQEKRTILDMYRNDIMKFATGYELKAENIFDNIPAQLQRHDKKFKLSMLKENARFRDYEDAFFWLNSSMIANFCYNTTEPNLGLKLSEDNLTFKCYMGDTGLLISHSFDEKTIMQEEIYKKLLFNKLEINFGMVIENMVAQMLTASNHKLYFYAKSDRKNKENRMKIDFLIAKSKITNKHNISPIEVKSTKNYTFSSLNKMREKYSPYLSTCYVIHMDDLKIENDIVFLPIYMTCFL